MAVSLRTGRGGARSVAVVVAVGACLGLGCSSEEKVEPVVRGPVYRGTLDVDIVERADIVLEVDAEGGFAVALTPQGKAGEGFVTAGVTVEARGKVEGFPEAGLELFVAEWVGAGAGCGGEGVVMAMSLARRGEARRFAGALTAYCGEEARGVPAGVMRVSGELGE